MNNDAEKFSNFTAFERDLDFLTQRFSPRLPRYTSYPTAAQFTPVFDRTQLETHLVETFAPKTSASIYVHIPFCAKLCYFCACNKIISTKESDKIEYLKLLREEIALHRARELSIRELHLGGGSPSYLSAEQLSELHEILSPLGNFRSAEKSIEIDCRTFDTKKLNTLYALGYRRYSLGVQDFDPEIQEIINRNQTATSVIEATQAIRALRYTSINYDLVYGLPGQTLHSFGETLKQTIELSPDRIALYGYADVQWKVKVQKAMARHHLPRAIDRLQLFHQALTHFQEAGYRYIGLDHFAKPEDELSQALDRGKLRRNFMGYTTQSGSVLLGLGISAISDTGEYLAQKYLGIDNYRSKIQAGFLPIERVIHRSSADAIRAYCIESLMCRRELQLNELRSAFPGEETETCFVHGAEKIRALIPTELAQTSVDEIRISERGSLFMRFIVSVFDDYVTPHSAKFSAAV